MLFFYSLQTFFFKIIFFKKNLSGTLIECLMVSIHIRTDTLLVLFLAQTVCKGYQQTTKVTVCKERVNYVLVILLSFHISNVIPYVSKRSCTLHIGHLMWGIQYAMQHVTQFSLLLYVMCKIKNNTICQLMHNTYN